MPVVISHQEIRAEIERISYKHRVTILFACESGSRAWGFASTDSDYDVRFIYLHPTSEYLRVSPLRDVIEEPIHDGLDFSGWDLPKALGLFRKSNPPLHEWLQSPIVYHEVNGFRERMKALIPAYYSPIGCMHHYLHMAQRTHRAYLTGDEVILKKYFYALRPVLACLWIERGMGVVPTEFSTLLEGTVSDPSLLAAVETLRKMKSAGQELDLAPRIDVISDFIDHHIERIAANEQPVPETQDWEKLDQFFRETLRDIHGTRLQA